MAPTLFTSPFRDNLSARGHLLSLSKLFEFGSGGIDLVKSKSFGLVHSSALCFKYVVNRRLKIHIAWERDRVAKGQDLGGPETADSVFSVDPVEEVG